jgi:hypothetical protein
MDKKHLLYKVICGILSNCRSKNPDFFDLFYGKDLGDLEVHKEICFPADSIDLFVWHESKELIRARWLDWTRERPKHRGTGTFSKDCNQIDRRLQQRERVGLPSIGENKRNAENQSMRELLTRKCGLLVGEGLVNHINAVDVCLLLDECYSSLFNRFTEDGLKIVNEYVAQTNPELLDALIEMTNRRTHQLRLLHESWNMDDNPKMAQGFLENFQLVIHTTNISLTLESVVLQF